MLLVHIAPIYSLRKSFRKSSVRYSASFSKNETIALDKLHQEIKRLALITYYSNNKNARQILNREILPPVSYTHLPTVLGLVVMCLFVNALQDEDFQTDNYLYPFLFTPAYMTKVNGCLLYTSAVEVL